jgi:hypothetical protein
MTELTERPGRKTGKNPESKRRFGIDYGAGKLILGRFRIPLPKSRIARLSVGSGLIFGGCLGFLPILGFWMLPLGFLILSQESAVARRWRRRLSVWWGRRGKSGA